MSRLIACVSEGVDDPLVVTASITHIGSQGLSPPQASSLGLGSGVTIAPKRSWKAKSSFISKSFSSAGLAKSAAAVRDSDRRGVGGWLQFHAYGGAINRVAPADTAFPHRNQIASVQYYVSGGLIDHEDSGKRCERCVSIACTQRSPLLKV